MTPHLEGLVVLWPILLFAEDTTSMFLHVSFRVRRITSPFLAMIVNDDL
jgi:hypothetical protein